MASNESIIESKTDNNTTSITNETVLTKNQIPVLGTTLENNVNDFGGQVDVYLNLLNNIGSKQSKYFVDMFKLPEDLLSYYDQLIQSQLKLYYPYLAVKGSTRNRYMNILIEILRLWIANYLSWISIGYGFALVRSNGYRRFVEEATARFINMLQSEKTSE